MVRTLSEFLIEIADDDVAVFGGRQPRGKPARQPRRHHDRLRGPRSFSPAHIRAKNRPMADMISTK